VTIASLTFAYAFLEVFLCAIISFKSEEKQALPFSSVVTGVIFVPFVFLALHFIKYDARYKVQYIDDDGVAEDIESPKVSDVVEHAKIPLQT
jgi:hypothetical protein